MTPKLGIPLNEPQTECRLCFVVTDDLTGTGLTDHYRDYHRVEREAQGIPPTEALREWMMRAVPFIEAVLIMADDKTPALALIADAAAIKKRLDSEPSLAERDFVAEATTPAEYREGAGATPPASGGIPLIDVKLPDLGILAAIFEDTPPAVLNSALLDSGEGLASWVVSHWVEYTRLASESSRDHVAPPAETHQQKQWRLRKEEEDRL